MQIGHAGDGGLYAEIVQDRSFDAIAAATGFQADTANGGSVNRQDVDLAALAAAFRPADQPIRHEWSGGAKTYASKREYLDERAASNYDAT